MNLQQLRDLRECLENNKEAQLELAMNYAAGNIGNLDRETAAGYIREVSVCKRGTKVRHSIVM